MINLKLHTILMTIWPTNSGKSVYCENILLPQLKDLWLNIQYISSDELRRELLGENLDKRDRRMLASSKETFTLLFEKIRVVTSYPINADIVVVNTLGLNQMFRDKIIEITKANNYYLDVLLFDYKNKNDYLINTDTLNKKLLFRHIERLKKDTLKEIKKSVYHNVYRLKENDFVLEDKSYNIASHEVIVDNIEEYNSYFLPEEFEYIVIWDLHECIDELIQLIEDCGAKIDSNWKITDSWNKRFVLCWDIIDKWSKTKQTIEFLHTNLSYFYFVKWNHENFVYKVLKWEITTNNLDKDFVSRYFGSLKILEKDDQLKNKFIEIVDLSKEFFRYESSDQGKLVFIATHVPCRQKYLGKINKDWLINQRTFKYDRELDIMTIIKDFLSESDRNYPIHFFWHLPFKDMMRTGNKIGVDTWCIHWNKLTGVHVWYIVRLYQQVFLKKQKAIDSKLHEFKRKKKNEVDISLLSFKDTRRLSYVLSNRVNYISGTMSPSEKDMSKWSLEDLAKWLDYYKDKWVSKVILQVKHMWSRANLYLNTDINKCYMVTRNGYKVDHIDLTNVFESMIKKFAKYMKDNDVETLVLDGELMPWFALGKGLIQKKFLTVNEGIKSELDYLGKNSFEKSLEEAIQKYEKSGFKQDSNQCNKKKLLEKYDHSTYQTYKNIWAIKEISYPIKEHKDAYKIFEKQIKLYAKDDEEFELKAFGILKIVKKDWSEQIMVDESNIDSYKLVSDDKYVVIDLQDKDYVKKSQKFYEQTVKDNKEWVVIKPEFNTQWLAPYLKVRNENYLTIVYWYDYKFAHKYKKLLEQKSIWKKLKVSIKEYEIWKEMLQTKLSDITSDNDDYKAIVANMLFEAEKEVGIDPRL